LSFLLLSLVLFDSVPAFTATLTVSFDSPGDVIFPDTISNTFRRSSTGAPLDVHLTSDPDDPRWSRYYLIPESGEQGQIVQLRFRLEGCGGDIEGNRIYVWESGIRKDATIVAREDDAVEFTFGLSVAVSWYLSSQDYPIHFEYMYIPNMDEPTWGKVRIVVSEPYFFETVDYETGPLDRWYRLMQYVWPDEYVDGGPWPESIYRVGEPLANQEVEIEGDGVLCSSASAQTDSDGVFGVVVYVDPFAFYSSSKVNAGEDRKAAQAATMRALRLKYKNLIHQQSITGNFCEVILVEGTVRVVEGEGTVTMGDILYPGQRLSLGASWGQKAQLGLRFVNGTDATVLQDVFTNACLADMITIGNSGIENDSVIQGNTPLMSLSRTLCEQVAGLPNTPEEWAKATGKVIVKSAASSLAPGTGLVGFAIKYGVKTAAGKTYDRIVNSGTTGGKAVRSIDLRATSAADPRIELSVYYDGSSRVAHNLASPLVLLASDSIAPPVNIGEGQWQEILDAAAPGRQWSQSPDTIDQEGPALRFSYDFIPASGIYHLDLRANDPAGIDASSLSIQIEGEDRTAQFIEQGTGSNFWRAEFGLSYYDAVHIQLADKLGHESTLTWSRSTQPPPPRIGRVIPGYPGGGKTQITWSPPEGITPDQVLFYEYRQLGGSPADLSWYSVGANTSASIPLPNLFPGQSFRVEVRLCDIQGRVGEFASTEDLYPSERPASLWIVR